jgi:hypothetical protein
LRLKNPRKPFVFRGRKGFSTAELGKIRRLAAVIIIIGARRLRRLEDGFKGGGGSGFAGRGRRSGGGGVGIEHGKTLAEA